MTDPIRLEPCAACGTSFPQASPTCPDCGAPRPGHRATAAGPRPGGAPVDVEELFEAFGSMLGGQQPSRRAVTGSVARAMLGRHLGCLVTVLGVVFGVPVLIGALTGNVLGALAWMLLVVGVAGLGLTAWLIRLVRPPRRGQQ